MRRTKADRHHRGEQASAGGFGPDGSDERKSGFEKIGADLLAKRCGWSEAPAYSSVDDGRGNPLHEPDPVLPGRRWAESVENDRRWHAPAVRKAVPEVSRGSRVLPELAADRHRSHDADGEQARWDRAIAKHYADDTEARVVARLHHMYQYSPVDLCRDVSTEQAAALVRHLVPKLAEITAEGAEVIDQIAQQVGTLAHQVPHLSAEMVQADQERLRRHHGRALEAMTFVVDENRGGGRNHRYERAVLVLLGLTDAAKLLLPKAEPVPLEPHADDWRRWRGLGTERLAECHAERNRGEDTEGAELCRRCFDWSETWHNGSVARRRPPSQVKQSEDRAVAEARRRIRGLSGDVIGSGPLLELLRTLTRPESVDLEDVARHKAARLPAPKHLSERERIKACSPLLRRLGLWPDVRGKANSLDAESKAIEQLRKMLPGAWRSRQEEFGVAAQTERRQIGPAKSARRKSASKLHPVRRVAAK
jgi:hypothetical protein